MKRNSHKKNLSISIILLLILVIGIGYAYLTSNLSISGTTGIVGNSWDIHFENLNVKDGSVTAINPATISNSTTDITYSIRLERPKDYYEFIVDVKNDGTLPGKVSISTLNGITSQAAPIVDYSITYTNGRSVNIGDILNAGAKKTIKVRVFYKDDIQVSDLPSSNLNLTLTYTLQYIQSDESEVNTDVLVEQLKAENSSCFTKYTGQVTDQPGQTVTASKVYFNKCADKRNIIFNNMCWQMIRTTETGGIKMLYNGEPNNGQCGSSRSNHTGIVGENGSSEILDGIYLYGNSFTYDTTTSEFTLLDTFTSTWSDSTYENLIGKYTCKNTNGICTTLYNINSYKTNTSAYTVSYTIGLTSYSQIGTSPFNTDSDRSLSMVGYMFNKAYKYNYLSPETNTYKYGNSFTYSNGTYTLSGTTQNINNWSTGYNTINNTHYTCWNTSGVCDTISYIFYSDYSGVFYINITDGKSVSDAIDEMLFASDVNKTNSSIKGIIDAWYKKNLLSNTSMLEDAVYCNARNIIDYGGWEPSGGSTFSSHYIQFKNYNLTKDISCLNETDQFAVSNNKAKLIYPVALLQDEEIYNINPTTSSSSLFTTNDTWWTISPYYYYNGANLHRVYTNGDGSYKSYSYIKNGVRPVVSLGSGAVISSGTGSETDPWIVE